MAIERNTQESFSKAKSFTSAERCATDKKADKQAHGVGSLLGFYI
jgi:hypothetical protein